MPIIGKDLLIPFVVGGTGEEAHEVKEATFNFGVPGRKKIEEDWFIRNYDLYDTNGTAEEKALIKNQRHVDIRTFATGSEENWTVGTAGPQEVLGNLSGLALPLAAGEITTSSVASHVNLSLEFSPQDYIILALPSFPLASITTSESYIDFTSHPAGNFATGPTVSVKFSESESTLEAGNSELRFSRSLLEHNELNLAQITGIRFRIKATGTATLVLAGLRLVSKNWTYSPLDFDNWNGRWAPPVPPNGSLSHAKGYSIQPILWRSTDLPGEEDPRPIDSKFGVVFNTGSQTNSNSFTLYAREVSEAFLTQVDLDGKLMAELDRHPQPDLGVSEFSGREVGGLDGIQLSELDGQEIVDLERIEDPVFQGWISFTVNWGNPSNVIVKNSAETGYTFSHPPFANNSYYIALVSLKGTTARLTIYALNPDFSINPTIFFDTTLIKDSGLFKRRKGRVGWKANLEDNEAFLGPIHPRGLTFAEYVSAPLKSFTPVEGARLSANFTENEELFEALQPLPSDASTTTLVRDSARSLSGSSWKTTTNGGTGQGIQSNTFALTDLSQAGISFSIWYPSGMPRLEAKLVSGQGAVIPITLPYLYRDQWQEIKINLSENLSPTGEFILVIEQPEEGFGSYWLDNISVFQRAVQWSARAIAEDPWESNEAPWTDFREIVNGKGGVMFSLLGDELQLRARARQQDAVVAGPPQIKPQYAQLGRLVWPENQLHPTGPTSHFTFASSAPTVVSEFIKFPEKPDKSRGDLAITSSYVLWTDELGGKKTPEQEEPWSIRRGPIAGGSAASIIESAEGHEFIARNIATDSNFLYFTHEKYIARAKFDGTSLENHWVTVPGAAASPFGVAVDNNYVYWADKKKNSIGRVKKTGEGIEEKFITGLLKPGDLAVNGTGLFWVNNESTIEKTSLSGTERKVLYSHPGAIRGLFAVSSGIMWTFYQESLSLSGVGKAANDGSKLIQEYISGSETTGGISANSEFIYWVNGEAVSRAELIEPNPLQVNFTSTATAGTYPLTGWEWDFGDGGIAIGPTASHTYVKNGTYSVTLTVTDGFGLRSSEIKSVTVG